MPGEMAGVRPGGGDLDDSGRAHQVGARARGALLGSPQGARPGERAWGRGRLGLPRAAALAAILRFGAGLARLTPVRRWLHSKPATRSTALGLRYRSGPWSLFSGRALALEVLAVRSLASFGFDVRHGSGQAERDIRDRSDERSKAPKAGIGSSGPAPRASTRMAHLPPYPRSPSSFLTMDMTSAL